MKGQGWECLGSVGGVVDVGVDDQHRPERGGQALEVGVAEIVEEFKAGGEALEEGASDEDG